MRDGYSDGGTKWDNVKLFLRSEEKEQEADIDFIRCD